MIKKIILSAIILASSYIGFSQSFSFTITGPTDVTEGFTVDYTVNYFNHPPTGANFKVTVVNGTLIPTSQLPPYQFIRVKWNCQAASGSITLTETTTPYSFTFNTTVLSYLSSTTYCSTAYPEKQNNNYGQFPNQLDVVYCSPYCASTYTYQWEVGDVPIGVFPQVPTNWTKITGAMSATYQPPVYNNDCIKAYRRRTTYSDVLGIGITKISTIAVISTFDFLNPGTISWNNIINNGVPVIAQSPATGGLCDGYNYQYTWELSVDGINYTSFGVVGTNNPNYPTGVQIPGSCYIRRRVDCGIQTLYSNVIHVIVQPLLPGTISGGGTYAFNTIPNVTQTPASGGVCNSLDYLYTWERAVNNGPWVTFGTGINYPANAGVIATCQVRRKVHCVYEDAYTAIITFTMLPYTSSNVENLNYVRVNDIVKPAVQSWEQADALPTGDKLQTTNYLDGFGRIIQTVVKQGSLKQTSTNLDPDNINNYQDIVNHIQYDGLGRADKGFLPYATTTNLGFYKTNAATEQQSFTNAKYGEPAGSPYTYSQTTYDGSPLNRVINQKLPGYYWNNAAVYNGISSEYEIYKAVENVRIWNIGFNSGDKPIDAGPYSDNKLIKSITKDEKDKLIIEYKDFSGNTVLKKVQEKEVGGGLDLNGYAGWLCTYYVYDDFGWLRYTITPKAVVQIMSTNPDPNTWIIDDNTKNGLCFYQEYDKRGRVSVKHSPDGGEVWLVYDNRDRLVFSQDANQRSRYLIPSKQNQWSFSLYDENDRSVVTGLINDPVQRSINVMQNIVESFNASAQNRQIDVYTGSTEKITAYNPVVGNFSGNPFSSFFTNSVIYYDEYNTSGIVFIPFSNNDFPPAAGNQYVDQPVKSLRTKGMVTGTKIRVLDENYDDGQISNDKFLSSISYIDERGRIIQSHAENILGGIDVASVQYDFAGKVLCTKAKHNAPGNVFNDLFIATRSDYDLLGRAKNLFKLYTKTNADIQNANLYKKLSIVTVDEFGRAKSKAIGADPDQVNNPGKSMEILDYNYNIQGNLTGINKDYALGTGAGSAQFGYRRFGMYVGYENSDGKFIAAQLNGNITGVIWRSQGDNTPRKYNYEYDNINRFTAANFLQKEKPSDPDNTWSINKVDLSAYVTYKDANGNIGTMKQTGIIPGTAGGVLIDDLSYDYYDKSNKLKTIIDVAFGGSNVQNGKQGDFMNFTPSGLQDYEYDKNGNLKNDKNKNIIAGTGGVDGIISNFLDLPQQITINGKSRTEYTYDAAGNKLAKKVTPLTTGAPPPKTTYYVGGFVYEAATGQPTELQYILNEEGKLRIMQPVAAWSGPSLQVNYLETRGNVEIANTGGTGNPNKWGVWDYFIKDNLSNNRMVLTEEYQQQQMLCSMELTPQVRKDEEEATFSNTPNNNELANTRQDKPGGWSNNSSIKVSKLLNIGNTSIGPNAILKVMAGDEIQGKFSYYYVAGGTSQNGNLLSNIVNSLLLALGGSSNTTSGVKDNIAQPYLSSINGPVNSFLNQNNQQSGNSQTPKAFLNYIFFDEQFRYVDDVQSSGAIRVQDIPTGSNSIQKTLPFNTKAVKNGYVYIYLSNQSQNIPVYFDDLQIIHNRGAMLEDNAYYPYGLKIQGISAKAALKPKTKAGYQGDYSEHDEETGYNEFVLRSFDPQIGRWIQVDPYDVEPGMYNGMGNNPVNSVDPSGGYDWFAGLVNGVRTVIQDRGNHSATMLEQGATLTNIGSDDASFSEVEFAASLKFGGLPQTIVSLSQEVVVQSLPSLEGSWVENYLGGNKSSFDANGNAKIFEYDPGDNAFWKATTFIGNVGSNIINSVKYTATTSPGQQTLDASIGLWNTAKYCFTTPDYQKGIDLFDAARDPHTYEKAVAIVTMAYATKSMVASDEAILAGKGRAFHSGPGTQEIAIENGYQTLGQTRAGKNLQNLITSKNIPWEGAGGSQSMWRRLSAVWAKGVPDGSSVPVFLNNSKIGSIWLTTELPILQLKAVNLLYQ